MPNRKRVHSHNPNVSGGGGGPPAAAGNLSWGPHFGNRPEIEAGVHADLESVNLQHTADVGVHADLEQVNLAHTAEVGLLPDLVSVNLAGTARAGAHAQVTDLDLTYAAEGVGVLPDLVSVDLAGTARAGVLPDLATVDLAGTARTGVLPDLVSLSLAHTADVGLLPALVSLGMAATARSGAHVSGTALGAPFWQASTTAAVGAALSTSLTVNRPPGTAQGHFLLAFVGTADAANTPTISPPSGWSTAESRNFAGAARQFASKCFYKHAGASESTSYKFNFSATITLAVGEIHRLTAVSTSTPIDASTTATLSAAALDPDPNDPALTTASTNIMMVGWLLHDHAALSQTHTAQAGHEERTDFQASLGALFLGSHSQTRVFAVPGSIAATTHNCTETAATDAVLHRIALRRATLVMST